MKQDEGDLYVYLARSATLRARHMKVKRNWKLVCWK